MKRNGLRILLGLLVLGVWGAVIGKVFHRTTDAGTGNLATTSAAARPEQRTDSLDPRIPLLQRDPFHGSVPRPAQHVPAQGAVAARARTAPPPKAPATSTWPQVNFRGLMRQPGDTTQSIAFLSVNGKDVLLPKGREMNGLRVRSLARDSVVLEHQGERRVLRRQ
ncbi:MAG TPA: hypothetical protein VGE21_05905 [Flavobacteriales bacterium]